MASTFTWKVRYGASPGTEVSSQYLYLYGVDEAPAVANDYRDITKCLRYHGNSTVYSYERWARGNWSGTYSSIGDIVVYASAGTLNTTDGWQLKAGKSSSYATPTNDASTIATSPLANWDSYAEGFTFTHSGGYTTEYFVMQSSVPSTAPAGSEMGTITITISWLET